MSAPETARTQIWMLRMVTHPDGVEAGFAAARDEGLLPPGIVDPADLVVPGDRMTAVERLHVYGYAYFARLLDVLEDEYPVACALIGDGARDLLKRFLVEHPSRTYTLGRLSVGFPDWVEEHAGACVSDVARIERALEEVIDAVTEDPLAHEALTAIPMEDWAALHLRPSASMVLFPLRHRVNAVMNAHKRGEELVLPSPSPEPLFGCVHRQGFTPWRREVNAVQHALLATLRAGGTLGDALEAALDVEGADPQALLGSLGDWFADWMGDGLFAAID